MLKEGLTHTSVKTVDECDTARVMGSGDLDVCATPAMMALMENAAMLAVAGELADGLTTVGGYIESSHLRPTKPGRRIEATATLLKIDGKKLTFSIEARESENGAVIGRGTHLRFIVAGDKFMNF